MTITDKTELDKRTVREILENGFRGINLPEIQEEDLPFGAYTNKQMIGIFLERPLTLLALMTEVPLFKGDPFKKRRLLSEIVDENLIPPEVKLDQGRRFGLELQDILDKSDISFSETDKVLPIMLALAQLNYPGYEIEENKILFPDGGIARLTENSLRFR